MKSLRKAPEVPFHRENIAVFNVMLPAWADTPFSPAYVVHTYVVLLYIIYYVVLQLGKEIKKASDELMLLILHW